MPKISIILPVYNGSKYICESLDSIVNQTYEDWELIIVNDCSTDNTLSVVEEYMLRDERIKVITNDENQKLPKSLNIGFRLAKGEYLTWTSDDNMFYESALQTMVDYLDVKTEYSMVCTDYECINSKGKVINTVADFDELKLLYRNCVGACFLYRREVLDEIGEYDPSLFLIEDYDYWFRIVQSGRKIGRISEVLYKYRVHDMSLTSLQLNKVQLRLKEYQKSKIIYIIENLKSEEKYLVDFYYGLCETWSLKEIESMFVGKSEVIDSDKELDENKPYIIYGAGVFGRKAHKLLGERAYYFADKNNEKIGTIIDGIQVISPDEAIEKKEKYNICLALSHESIYHAYNYLKLIGLDEYVSFYKLENLKK